ncbi:MAG: glycosyltransferase family 1 protein [Acidobacteria bacterium]|nr:glycosyltransferase family 1 protein [Acidobacteriota bacterium]
MLRLDSDMFFDLLFLRRHLRQVEQAFREFAPSVVHVTGPSDCGMMGMILAHRHEIPCVASWHTNLHEYAVRRLPGWASFTKPFVERQSLNLLSRYYGCASQTLAPNPELVRLMERLTGKPCGLMERGVDTELFHPAKRTRGDYEEFRIGYAGRLTPEKDVHCLVRVQERLSQLTKQPFHFAIAGQGGERAHLEKHLNNVTFLGVLRGETLARAYAGFDALLFPSRTDTFGNVVLEALASAVPPLVSDLGGPKYLVDHCETGFVCGDDEEFAVRLKELMEAPARLTGMRIAARRAAGKRTWPAVFERLYNTYSALAG